MAPFIRTHGLAIAIQFFSECTEINGLLITDWKRITNGGLQQSHLRHPRVHLG